MFALLSLWSGHAMGHVGSAIPLAAQRPNGRTTWGCDVQDFGDGDRWSECAGPDKATLGRQKHLTYPQLMPGGFWMGRNSYTGSDSNALPLVRGQLQPWTVGTPGPLEFENMEFR
uniref:Uncharacterized protein n=2 Tax=Hemiselmis andersenii TaxID=464988 RepID=A0A6U4LPS5_HEMAN|eukprot:CAMPEP_0114116742 /NCGR_PEP_ID=MMETSP0043_2-20121206/4659_1 /TAXON_ID=464988 /ORGANISM="Hemiselmis andersenii, Strain CCMP644" /LENGTH=114 /DNA_ID=CAMNT_0001209081 /DNA_START=1 /DNA_END=345 /DNA_ORIENTATION=+